MSRRNKSKLPLIAAALGGASLAGFGLSLGRDTYKSVKKNIEIILLLIVVGGFLYCAYLGGRGLTRGHDRNTVERVLFTYIGNAIVLALSWAGITAVLYFFMLLISSSSDSVHHHAMLIFCFKLAAYPTALGAVIGMSIGLFVAA